MKLFYYQAPQGNVGDDLNVWLWPKILSSVLDDDNEHLLLGIGTLLNHKIPFAKKYTVLTSGVGYGDLPNINTGEWSFIGLRGPLSQKSLGIIEKDISLLDGAYLLPRYLRQEHVIKHKVGYIPHVDSMIHGLWQEVTDIAGMKLIDPRWPVEKFVKELCSCEKVITEAMHGAIIADAYNIAWQPTKAYHYINEFKWEDWAKSLDMDIDLNIIEPTWVGDKGKSVKRKAINTTKRLILSSGFTPKNWCPVPPIRSAQSTLEEIAKSLINNSEKCRFYLSDQELKRVKTDILLERINKLLLR